MVGEGKNIPTHSLNFLCLLELIENLYSSVITPLQTGNGWMKIGIVSRIKVMNLHIHCV
jgi:hypothetical protein